MHVGAARRAFRARLPQISHFAASKSTFSYELSYEPTSKSTFRARLPSIFITCHKMPRLPRNLHLVTTLRSADNAIHKKHAASAAPATQNEIRGVQSAAPATKNATHLLKMLRSIAPATQKDFWHVLKHVGMPRSATPATRNEAARRWKAPKVTPFAKLPIGTARRPSRGRLRTVANGCERLRTVADVNATSAEHSSTPTPPEWNGNPCYAFGKNIHQRWWNLVFSHHFWFETNFLRVNVCFLLVQSLIFMIEYYKIIQNHNLKSSPCSRVTPRSPGDQIVFC